MEALIYVILLEGNNYFIYSSFTTNHLKIKEECEILYDYPKKHKPLFVISQFGNKTKMDIQSMVLEYMYIYGIDKVRGGIFQEVVLPESKLNIISEFFDYYDLDQEKLLEFSEELKTNSLVKIESLKKELKKEIDSLDEKRTLLDTFKYIDKINELDFFFIEKIQWLKSFVDNKKNDRDIVLLEDENVIFETIIYYFKHIVFIASCFKDENNYEINQTKLEEIKNIFQNEITDKTMETIELFEMYFYWIYNKIKEYEFDLSTKNIKEMETKYKIIINYIPEIEKGEK